MLRRVVASLTAIALSLGASTALAFPHVVAPGETLVQIAERIYGRIEMEQLLVAANSLDMGQGIAITAGMRLEIPALSYRRASASDTWAGMALELLGDSRRSDVLALANDSMPWLPPSDGQEIVVPYNLRVVAGEGDSLATIAYRFLGKRDLAWTLDRYNHLKGDPLRRGSVILVPLTDLPLTPAGRLEAASAGAMTRSQGDASTREAQLQATIELPKLAADVRQGRYIEAVARGSMLLGVGKLAKDQLAAAQRQLLEAYVALGASGRAEAACAAWRAADPAAQLDPIELSPKIIAACAAALGTDPR